MKIAAFLFVFTGALAFALWYSNTLPVLSIACTLIGGFSLAVVVGNHAMAVQHPDVIVRGQKNVALIALMKGIERELDQRMQRESNAGYEEPMACYPVEMEIG